MINKNIEIVYSTNKGSRTLAFKTASAIENVLRKHFVNVVTVEVNNLKDLENLIKRNPDLVFNGVKKLTGADGKNISVLRYLENAKILVTGSNAKAIELEGDKAETKKMIMKANLLTPGFMKASVRHKYTEESIEMKFPFFIKPTNSGSGQGIDEASVVRNYHDFNEKMQSLSREGFRDVLMEKYLTGREFTVAVIKNKNQDEYDITPIELVAPINQRGDRILGSEIKHADVEKSSPVFHEALKSELIDFAESVFKTLNGRDYGRIDIRLDEEGNLHFLEANLMPGLTDRGYFFRGVHLYDDRSYENVILSIAQLALSR